MSKPCYKREVCAIIVTQQGEISVGENLIYNDEVTECPRAKGEGYEKCTSICAQKGHAETEAIRKAKDSGYDLEGGNLYLMGHHRICGPCKEACDNAGLIVNIVNKEGK